MRVPPCWLFSLIEQREKSASGRPLRLRPGFVNIDRAYERGAEGSGLSLVVGDGGLGPAGEDGIDDGGGSVDFDGMRDCPLGWNRTTPDASGGCYRQSTGEYDGRDDLGRAGAGSRQP